MESKENLEEELNELEEEIKKIRADIKRYPDYFGVNGWRDILEARVHEANQIKVKLS